MANSNDMTLSHAAAKMVKAYGGKYVFTIAGAPLNFLYHCQADEGIEVLLGRSERSILSMADAYGRMTGEPTFGYVQFGVGAVSLPPVFAEAGWGQSPLVVVSGCTNADTEFRYEYQEADALPMMSTTTKWAGRLPSAHRIGDVFRTAVRAAISSVPGPTFLEIPYDMFTAPYEGSEDLRAEPNMMRVGDRRPEPDDASIDQAIKLLAGAKRPIILAGGEVMFSKAWDELVALAEALSIPVATSIAGKGAISETHPLAVGVVGRYRRFVANEVMNDADCILNIGSQFNAMTSDTFKIPASGIPIIHCSLDDMSLGRTYKESVSINADPQAVLKALLAAADAAALDGSGWSNWKNASQKKVEDWRERFRKAAETKAVNGRINTIHLMHALNEHIQGDDVFISDTGNTTRWVAGLVDVKQAGRNYLRAAGSLGWAFPAGFGAKLAAGPDRRVFTVSGDGGMGYHIGDLETAIRLNLPSITIINNNASFAGYQGLLNRNLGYEAPCPPEFSKFLDLNFADIATGFGAYGERVTDADEIIPALRRAEESGKPSIIDVSTSPDVRSGIKDAADLN
jgi:acetolactate synthase-1/2/3 large subunit